MPTDACTCTWGTHVTTTYPSGVSAYGITANDPKCPHHGTDPSTQAAVSIPNDAPAESDEGTALIVQLRVARPENDTRSADEIVTALMGAIHVGLEGAEDAGVDAPDPSDVTLVFADDEDPD